MELIDKIDQIIAAMKKKQVAFLAKQLSANFVLGYKSHIPGQKKVPTIAKLQLDAVKFLAKEQMGFLNEFNSALGAQITTKIKAMMADGKGYAEIRKEMIPYIQKVFNSEDTVTINHVGDTRTVLSVAKDGTISKSEKVITQEYSATIEQYSDLFSRTVAHQAYEKGRAAGYQAEGVTSWRFIGSDDERTRISHLALLGQVFEYGTPQSDLGEQVLQEINCRHRAIPFFDDPKLDTPQSKYDKLKDDAGLFWDESANEWSIKSNIMSYNENHDELGSK